MSLLSILALSTVLPTLVVAACIARSGRERPAAGYLLAALLVVIASLTVASVILSSYRYRAYFPLAHLANLTIMAIGPLLYLYAKSSVQRAFRFKRAYWLSFLPFAAAFSFYLYGTVRLGLFRDKNTRMLAYKIVETAWNSGYFVAVVAVILKNGIPARRMIADFSDWRLTWIRFLFLSLVAVIAGKFYASIACDYLGSSHRYFTGLSLYFAFICAVTSLALYAFMNRSRMFSPAERYRDSTLTDRELESFHRALLAFMDSDQPFLDPDLSLPRLAEMSRIPQKTLSRVINERVGVNFNDFVNEYRIRESCRLLSSRPSGTPVLDILYESGFNSKSTFNDAFKKKTGKTPSEFRAGAAS